MDPEKTYLITMLNELKDAIREGNKDEIKKIIDRFHRNLVRNKQLLSEQYASGNQCVTQGDLILAACRNKQVDTLYYLLKETDILDHLPGAIFDDTKVKEQRTEAFKHALRLDAFPMVEMLYDYWCGDLHCIGHDFDKLRTLGRMLEDARVECDDKNERLVLNIHSLIQFNAFQQVLYSTLCRETNSVAKNLVNVLIIYDEYSDLKNVRKPHEDKEKEDTSSEYMKIHAYINYEVYFRKLDFNVALLILENLFILKQHLNSFFEEKLDSEANQPAEQPSIYSDMISLCKEMQCALYHFIYRSNEDWRLYLPRNRQITTEEHHRGTHKGKILYNLSITYDVNKIKNGPVLFLERKSFNKSLNELKIILENYVIHEEYEDPAKVGQNSKQKVKKVLDANYLSRTMYMSDYYSLRKIVYYLKALEDTEDINVLMIERVLQVTGEMLKSTHESYHLLKSTRSLLQIAMSVETVNYLRDIRNFLSKTKKRQLSIRIGIANEQGLFVNIKQDLKNIRQIINSIVDIYKPILDKSLLKKGLGLLEERVKNLKKCDEINRLYAYINRYYKLNGDQLSEDVLQELTAYTGLTRNLLLEFFWIWSNMDDILSKIQSAETTIREKVVRILPTYNQNIRQTLELPDDSENVANDSLTLNKIKDFSDYWEAINNMLSFCKDECGELFAPIAPKLPIKERDLATVTNILAELDVICRSTSSCENLTGKHSFGGIEKLHGISKQVSKSGTIEGKRKELIDCLINRVNLLKDTLQYPQHIPLEGIAPSDQHLRRYKHDQKFRFVLEMILADIANVLVECKQKLLMNKSAKLLREIKLVNVLNHGDAFLEVIGDVFDSYALSTDLLSKAIMFAKDGESIEALFKLIQDNIDYETIEQEKLENMNDGQKIHYKKFQSSPNWKSYVKLVHPPAWKSENK